MYNIIPAQMPEEADIMKDNKLTNQNEYSNNATPFASIKEE